MRYHPSMSDETFPGFARHGFRHRLLIAFDRREAEALAAEAGARDTDPASVVRAVVRAWREIRNGGGSSTKGNE